MLLAALSLQVGINGKVPKPSKLDELPAIVVCNKEIVRLLN